jgi:hypothetical protein
VSTTIWNAILLESGMNVRYNLGYEHDQLERKMRVKKLKNKPNGLDIWLEMRFWVEIKKIKAN